MVVLGWREREEAVGRQVMGVRGRWLRLSTKGKRTGWESDGRGEDVVGRRREPRKERVVRTVAAQRIRSLQHRRYQYHSELESGMRYVTRYKALDLRRPLQELSRPISTPTATPLSASRHPDARDCSPRET